MEKVDTPRAGIDLLIILIASVIICSTSLQRAAELYIEPDSVEYVASAIESAQSGEYLFTINGQSFPPRYPPLFTTFALAPIYGLLSATSLDDYLGVGIYAVLFFAVLTVLCAAYIGKEIGDRAGALFAVLFLLSNGLFRNFAVEIMADVPSLAGFALLAVIFVRTGATLSPRAALLGGIGAGIALFHSGGIFGLSALLLLGYRFPKRALFLFSIPLALICFVALYQWSTFGSPLRTGYHLWTPYPYESFAATFSLRHLITNLPAALARDDLLSGLLLVVVLSWGVLRWGYTSGDKRADALRSLLLFMVLSVVPQAIFYLFYFFSSNRFFLPLIAFNLISCGAVCGVLVSKYCGARMSSYGARALLILIASVPLLTTSILPHPKKEYTRGELVTQIQEHTPPHAVIITGMNPAFLTAALGADSSRTILPISRRIEYASKLIAPHGVQMSATQWERRRSHRCKELQEAGAVEVFPVVADQGIQYIEGELREGREIYFADYNVTAEERAVLKGRFGLRKITEQLWKVAHS